MAMKESYPTAQKNVYSVPFFAEEQEELVLWFFTGSKCNLECTHCYVEAGPRANRHPLLQYRTFKNHLDTALAGSYKTLEIYFTGGEPFINPDILMFLKDSLQHGNTTILTNATRITESVATHLANFQKQSSHKLTFRVSFEGPDAESNDRIRGPNSFRRALNGLRNLDNSGFTPIITITRLWPDSQIEEVKNQFITFLEAEGIPVDNQLIKILPPLRIGREALRDRPYTENELFTEQCFVDYDYNDLQCSKCRIISENGIWVCPILINEAGARMGDTLAESTRPFPMIYMVCWTCRMEGMSCTNEGLE